MMDNWLEALSDYLEEFSADDIRRGFHLYREKAITHVSRAGDLYLVNISDGSSHTIHYQLEEGQCRGFATPEPEDDEHGHMLYAGALELHKLLMGNRPIPENRPASTRLKKQDEDMQSWLAFVRDAQPKKRLSTEQQSYLTNVWEIFSRLTSREKLQPRHLRQIEKTFQPRNLKPFDFWEIKPETPQQFWQFVAYALQQHDHPIPEFLQAITDTDAIHSLVQRHTRRRHTERWREYIAESHSKALVRETLNTEVRLVIGRTRCQWEIREPGHGEFVELRREDFLDWYAREEEGDLALSKSGLLLWPYLVAHWQRAKELALNLTRLSTASLLNRILQDQNTFPCLLYDDGRELVWEDIPLSWQCRVSATDPDFYLLEMIDGHGNPAPQNTVHLPGTRNLYLWDNRVFYGPRPLGFHPRYPCGGELPREVVESTQGLNFLDSLGAPPPDEILDQVETREYEIQIRAWLETLSKPRGEDCRQTLFEVTACEPRSGRTERLGPTGWETTSAGALPENRQDSGAEHPGSDDEDPHFLLFQQKHKQESVRLLQALGARPRRNVAGWALRMEENTAEDLLEWIQALPDFIKIQLKGELASLQQAPVEAQVLLNVKSSGIDWLDVEISLNTEEGQLSQDNLRQLLEARGHLTYIPGQGWRRLKLNIDDKQAAHLEAAGIQPWTEGKTRERLHVLSVSQPGFEVLFNQEDWETILRQKTAFQPREPLALPEGLKATLRSYQKEGFDFLCYLARNNFGGILADDMGLGKTVQTLAWLLWLKERNSAAGEPSRILILCPKSVMNAWQTETANFTPTLSTTLYQPGMLREKKLEKTADLVIANYTQMRLNTKDFRSVEWSAVVLDEGQYIKSPNSATARAAFSLQAKNRLVLTGTPIENRLLDIWSIMNFAMPGVLGSRNSFLKFYDQNRAPQAADYVRKRLRPFMLRRTKEEAARDLPDRLSEVLNIRMEGKQQTLYDAELQDARRALLKIDSPEEFQNQRFSILRSLTRLRQICCDPQLLLKGRRRWPSAKLERLLEMVQELLEEGHKVLIFSQFVSMLEIIRAEFEALSIPYLYLTGRSENRGAIVDNFQQSADPTVFLLSLRAAGAGINLNTASYVFLYDPWWNPAVEEQAINRAHRIGTRNNVIIYRLVAEDSIEQKMQDLKSVKSKLASRVVDEDANTLPDTLSLEDLRELLGTGEDPSGA